MELPDGLGRIGVAGARQWLLNGAEQLCSCGTVPHQLGTGRS